MKYCDTLVINGTTVAGEQGSQPVINPATEEVVASSPQASVSQLDQAVAAARDAFADWSRCDDQVRKDALLRIADRIEEHSDELARILVSEQGKPLMIAQREVAASVAWTRYTANLELKVDLVLDSPEKRIEVHRKPLGVVASITPWNWPLMILIWHIMPAIRTGNTVVCKPSEYTPFNALRLIEIIADELPAGVVNIVTGAGEIGQAISEHPGINKVVFTGSTRTGKQIMRAAAGNLKRLTLELGGNDAGIVLPDADLDSIAQPLFIAAFKNMGQTCAALKRLYVHEDMYDALCDKLVAVASKQKVGNGLDEGVTFGPVQNKAQYDYLNALLDDIRATGGRILCGGNSSLERGYFIDPTIVADVDQRSRIVQEEQFGPILPVIRYSNLDEALAMANDTDEGLAGSVWGKDMELASDIAHRMECGSTWINGHGDLHPAAPFGGCKQSGIGVEFGEEGLHEYTRTHTHHIVK
ncbi:aldehyde dehydrogenase family protein [Marinobacterium sp. YM272]|uniref:aldehyde dehydrogenase family protein n=1 Tax=Marinobacterium sp. YM272 TaxID=3421654 RepID=UPI003D7F7F2E